MKRGLKIYIGADHAGYKLKEKIKEVLSKKDIYFEDLGTYDLNKKDDYPDFAFAVARRVARDGESARGILICGTGTGMVIAANKVKGIRASVGYDDYSVQKGREHNDVNVLCLRGRRFSDAKNLRLVRIWLGEKFSGEKRHRRRLRKIEGFER